MKLIMLGAPGAGKGTQASLLAGLYDIPHISTGDIFRDNIKRGTPIGKEVKLIIDAGALVPDDLTISLVKERLKREDCLKGYLLDGFPRNLYQAESLESVAPPDMAVNVDIDQDILVSRLAGRRACLLYTSPGGRIKKEAPIDASNAMVICPKCGQPTRVGYRVEKQGDKAVKVRVCKKKVNGAVCGASLDK